MRRRHREAAPAGDRSRQTGKRRRSNRNRCRHRFERGLSQLPCAGSRRSDKLRGSRLLRSLSDRRDPAHGSWLRSFEAAGFFAMLANIGKENPAKWIFSIAQRTDNLLSFSSILFKEQDVTPCRRAEM